MSFKKNFNTDKKPPKSFQSENSARSFLKAENLFAYSVSHSNSKGTR